MYAEILDLLIADDRVIVADCGAGATSDVAREVLARATQLVVVPAAQIDGSTRYWRRSTSWSTCAHQAARRCGGGHHTFRLHDP